MYFELNQNEFLKNSYIRTFKEIVFLKYCIFIKSKRNETKYYFDSDSLRSVLVYES